MKSNFDPRLRSISLRRRHAYILRERFFYFLKKKYFEKTIGFFTIYQKNWASFLNRISYRLFNKPSALFLATKYFSFSDFFLGKKSPFTLNYKISYLFRSIFKFYPLKISLLKRARFINNDVPTTDKASLLLAFSFLSSNCRFISSKKVRTGGLPLLPSSSSFSFLSAIKKKLFLKLGGTTLSLRINKLFNIFSFKGNKNKLFRLFSLVTFSKHYFLFRVFNHQLFLQLKKIMLDSFFDEPFNSNDTEVSNFYEISNNKKVSYVVKRLLGFNFHFNKNKVGIFFSPLFKAICLSSSIRYLFNSFRSFYLFTELKSLKKSGRSFTLPVPIKSQNRRKFIFYHWLKTSVLARSEFSFSNRLSGELADIGFRRGSTLSKLHSLSKSIKTNRVLIRKSRLSLI